MSAFTIDDARWIAQKAVRHRYERDAKNERDIHEPSSDRPSALTGKEEELLVALRQAEEVHGQALVKLEEAWAHIEQRKLMIVERDGAHATFLKDAKTLLNTWRSMDQTARRSLAWHCHTVGPIARGVAWALGEHYDLDKIVANRDWALANLVAAATAATEDITFEGEEGRPSTNDALREFARVLSEFWSRTTNQRFSVNFNRQARVPLSAAANMLCEAAHRLNRGYTLSNCESVMNDLRKGT